MCGGGCSLHGLPAMGGGGGCGSRSHIDPSSVQLTARGGGIALRCVDGMVQASKTAVAWQARSEIWVMWVSDGASTDSSFVFAEY
jgi:hypothetical protein